MLLIEKKANFYNRFHEKKIDVNDLCFITKFLKQKNNLNFNAYSIILNFGFKSIDFNKKKMAPFLFILEILSNQRNYATRAKKNVIHLGIKRNTFVGCKVTLRGKNLYNFLDTLILYAPQIEQANFIKKYDLKKNKLNNFSFWLSQLFKFYQIKNLQNDDIQKLHVNFLFKNELIEEKTFFFTSNNLPIFHK